MRSTALALILALEFCSGALVAGCGSPSSSGMQPPSPDGGEAGGKDSAAPKDAAPDVILDPKNCVPPGGAGYCSPAGGQCDRAGPGGTAEICTGDLAGTPKHGWYCTLPCSKPSECTGAATCASTPMGSRCVPKSCEYLLPDAGTGDSGKGSDGSSTDSAADGPNDAASDGSSLDAHD